MIALTFPNCSSVTVSTLFKIIVLQNSICCIRRFSISSSSISSFTRFSPHPNSSAILATSTTDTILSSLAIFALLSYEPSNIVIDWAIGIGSQIPLASIKI